MALSAAPTTSSEVTLRLTRRHWRVLALSLWVALAPAAKAQDAPRDPPSRAGRVVEVVGEAWLFDHETREWVRLSRNQTVGEGDRVRTDERGRVSLRVGSTTIWVDERSDLELSQLDEGRTLLQVDRGDVAVRLRSAENAQETRLRTREGTAQPEREGLYRVEQLDRGSKAYVWQGRLRFDWARGAAPVWLGTGEQVEFWWPDGPRAERGPLYSDAFGDWVLAASRDEGDRPVARYVSPEMTGAEDLDRYGRWESSPEYGTVWIPTTVVVADWAPYRYGRWVWSRHWGWTWVDDAPWGFAPFHYGRWVSWGGRWCWAPGPYVHRPVYAPALVGWVGGGSSVSVNITIGSRPPPPAFGWYPLAPREVYLPAYRHTPRYVERLNDPRDLRDPVTVQRPHRYRDVPAAVSLLPAPGAPIQPLPVRSDRKPDVSWFKPLPAAPARGDLAPVLPPAPTRAVDADLPRRDRDRDRERGDAGLGWRSDGGLPRREAPRAPDRSADRAPDGPTARLPSLAPPLATQPAPQPGPGGLPQGPSASPGLPTVTAPVAPPAARAADGAPTSRTPDTLPWRQRPGREEAPPAPAARELPPSRDTAWREAQQREAELRQQREIQQQREMQQREQFQRESQQRELQQREQFQREAQQREMQQRDMQQREMQRRDEAPRRVEMPFRQPEAQRAPAPQPAARPQPRDEGPQRGRPDRRGDQPQQNER